MKKNILKCLEAVGHVALGFGIAWGLSFILPIWASACVAILAGLTREIWQNINDEPDDTTLFDVLIELIEMDKMDETESHWCHLPINADMLLDLAEWFGGAALFVVLAGTGVIYGS